MTKTNLDTRAQNIPVNKCTKPKAIDMPIPRAPRVRGGGKAAGDTAVGYTFAKAQSLGFVRRESHEMPGDKFHTVHRAP